MSDVIILKIDSTLLTLPRVLFARSTVFQDMFSFPSPSGTTPEGSTEANPLVLEGVDSMAFKVFARAAQASEIDHVAVPPLGLRNWPRAYELAVRWDMIQLQESLLASLKKKVKHNSAVGYIMLGLRMDNRDIFAMGVQRLLKRNKTLGNSEMLKLGPVLTPRFLQAREECLRNMLQASTQRDWNDRKLLDYWGETHDYDKHDIQTLLAIAIDLQYLPSRLTEEKETFIETTIESLWISRPGFNTIRRKKAMDAGSK